MLTVSDSDMPQGRTCHMEMHLLRPIVSKVLMIQKSVWADMMDLLVSDCAVVLENVVVSGASGGNELLRDWLIGR